MSIFIEFDRPDIMWLGAVTAISGDSLQYLEIDTMAGWKRKPRSIDLQDVTRIEFGGAFEKGMAIVAGPCPVERRI